MVKASVDSPAALRLVCGLIQARDWLLTRLLASTKLAAALSALAVASLLMTAVRLAPCGAASASTSVSACIAPAATETSPPAVNAVSTMLATVLAGCSVPMLVPSKASIALANRFCGAQPMVLNASVTPTAKPSDSITALLSASIVELLSAATLMSPPASARLWMICASALLSTRLVAIKALIASGEAAAGDSAAESAAGSAAAASSGAASVEVLPAALAEMLADCSAARARLPPDFRVASRASDWTAPRTSLRTTMPPIAMPPALVDDSETSASMAAVSLARNDRFSPALKLTSRLAVSLKRPSTLVRELTRLLARMKLAAALAVLDVTSLAIVAAIFASPWASRLMLPTADKVEPLTNTSVTADCSLPIAVPSKASRAANKTFCARQPMVLKANVTPTATPPASIVAALSAVICEALRAITSKLPPALMSLSSSVAVTLLRIRLVAIKALTASELGPAASEPAAPLVAGSSDGASSSGNDEVSPLRVAVIVAEPRASIVTSPPTSSAALSIQVLTTLRTSLRATKPPTAAPPALDEPMLTSASMPEVSLALTNRLPPIA